MNPYVTHKFSFQYSGITVLKKDKNLYELVNKCVLRCKEAIDKNELPFVSFQYEKRMEAEIQSFIPSFENKKDLIVLGIGGSALGAKAMQQSFYLRKDVKSSGKKVHILDNLDEEYIASLLKELNPLTTGVLVISKSGNTIESICQYFVFKEWLQEHLGNRWKDHCYFVTEAEEGFLREEAIREGLLSATIDKNLGGRYSVISVVGLLPAMFLGLDWKEMVRGKKEYNTAFLTSLAEDSLSQFPSYRLALWSYLSEESGMTEVIFFPYIPRFFGWSQWYAQLWAESLGKNGKGLIPIVAQGVTDQHSLQQMFLDGKKNKICLFITESKRNKQIVIPDTLNKQWMCIAGKSVKDILVAEYEGTRNAFVECKIPFMEYEIPEMTEYNVGKMIAILENATLLTGYLLDINPLNQPAVEHGKKITMSILKEEIVDVRDTINTEGGIVLF